MTQDEILRQEYMDWVGGSYTQVSPLVSNFQNNGREFSPLNKMDVLEKYYTEETVKPTDLLIESVKLFKEDSSYKNFLDMKSIFTDIENNMIRRDCIRCHNK